MPQTVPDGTNEQLLYIQSMLGQLRSMAAAEKCEMLAYLIEMAYIEAGDVIRGQRPKTVSTGHASGV